MIRKLAGAATLTGLAVHAGIEALKQGFPDPTARSEAVHDFAKEYFLPALLGENAIIAVGAENIPVSGPFMLAPSHTIWNDHFVVPEVVLSERPDVVFQFLGKHQLGKIPYVKEILEGTVVYVNRKSDTDPDERDKEIDELMRLHAQRIIDVPDGNGSGITYPWGTREKKGTLTNIGSGVIQTTAHMADITGIEQVILPVGVQGHEVRRIASYRMGLRQDPPAGVSIGEPIVITPNEARRIRIQGRRGEAVGRYQAILQRQIRYHVLVARGIACLEGEYPELAIPSKRKSQKNTNITERHSARSSQG